MATPPIKPLSRATLGKVLSSAGGSLTSVQSELAGPVGIPAGMVISEAVLEVKATVQQASNGELELEMLDSSFLGGTINPSAVSTLRVSFTAAALEPAATRPTGGGGRPTLNADRVRDAFSQRVDVRELEKVVGQLVVEPEYLPATGRWLVTARTPSGRVVRQQTLDDREPSS